MASVKLSDALAQLAKDGRLFHCHICLFIALFSLYEKSEFRDFFRVSRRELMKLSKIQSTATYHKCMQDLVAFGYINYTPSYDYYKGSWAQILNS